MHRRHALQLIGAAAAALPQLTAQTNRYQPTWDSLDRRANPSWYSEAKFGIFIHWGVYSVPSYAAVGVKDENPYAEWYWNSLTEGRKTAASTGHGAMTCDFHNRVYGADFPYFDFAPMFRAELFDPDHWADVFQRSGAKYVALTSKHHEGFTLWRTAEANRTWGRPWNSVDIGPKRDLLIDLSEAGRRKGLHMGIYYSMYEWYNPLWLSDKKRYVTEHLIPQFKDVVTHAKPSIIFSDGEWELTSAQWQVAGVAGLAVQRFAGGGRSGHQRSLGQRDAAQAWRILTLPSTRPACSNAAHAWEENRGMGYSYDYNRMETLKDYRTGREMVLMLMDIVSRGGNLLLDIGPTSRWPHPRYHGRPAEIHRKLASF